MMNYDRGLRAALGLLGGPLMAMGPGARYRLLGLVGRATGGGVDALLGGLGETLEETWGEEPLPTNDMDAVLGDTLRSLALDTLEVTHLPRVAPHQMGDWARLHSLFHLEGALEKGRGVLLLTAHFGQWRWLPRALAARGYPVRAVAPEPSAVAAPLGAAGGPVLELERRAQELTGVDPLWLRPPDYEEEAARFLAEGGIVVIPVDLAIGERWTTASLLRRPVQVPSTPFELALETRAPMLPSFVIRGPRRHRISFDREIRFHRTGDRPVDVASAASRFFRLFDAQVRRRPDHYLGYLRYRRVAQAAPDHALPALLA